MYVETLQDKAYELIEQAGRPVTHREVVVGTLGFDNATGPVARQLASSLLRTDIRFSYRAYEGWELAETPSPEAPLEDLTFTVVDTETSGSAPPSRITEVGAVRVRGKRIGKEFHSLVNSGASVPSAITELTGISTRMLADAPPAEVVIPQFRRFLGRTVMVAHNLPFDRKFVSHEFRLHGYGPPKAPGLCTLGLSRTLLRLRGNDLSQVAAHFGIKTPNRHRALGDARITAKILLRLLDLAKASGAATLADALSLYAPSRRR